MGGLVIGRTGSTGYCWIIVIVVVSVLLLVLTNLQRRLKFHAELAEGR